jgi:hypothetical protein
MVGATSATVEWRAVSGASGGDFRLKLGKQASWRTKLSTRSLGKWSRQQKSSSKYSRALLERVKRECRALRCAQVVMVMPGEGVENVPVT